MLARRLRRRPNIKSALVFSVSDAAQYESGDTSLHSAPHLTMRRRPNVGLLLGQRRRRWPRSKPTLGRRLVFAGFRPDEFCILSFVNEPFMICSVPPPPPPH